jgi:hypothetical protein
MKKLLIVATLVCMQIYGQGDERHEIQREFDDQCRVASHNFTVCLEKNDLKQNKKGEYSPNICEQQKSKKVAAAKKIRDEKLEKYKQEDRDKILSYIPESVRPYVQSLLYYFI